jgi:hypothetical protein
MDRLGNSWVGGGDALGRLVVTKEPQRCQHFAQALGFGCALTASLRPGRALHGERRRRNLIVETRP